MAIALLLLTALSLAGFLVTSAGGFALASQLVAHAPAARALVTHHILLATPTVLLSLFAQSMVIFYFIGTGKLVKDDVAAYPEKERAAILEALRRFKSKTSPPATLALPSAIGVFVVGGAVHTPALPSWTHLTASIAAVAVPAWAFAAEWQVVTENNRLMEDPRAFVRSTEQGARSKE